MKKKLLSLFLCMWFSISASADFEIHKSEDTISFSGSPDEGERIYITITKPPYDISDLTTANYGTGVYFADFINPESEYYEKQVTIRESYAFGIYDIQVVKTKTDGSITVIDDLFNHISPADKMACINEFKTISSDEFSEKWTYWKDNKNIITDETVKIDSENSSKIGKFFVYLRENSSKLSYSFSSVDDIEKMAKRAYGFYLIDTNASNLKDFFAENPMEEITSNADITEYADMYNKIKENIKDKDSFFKSAMQCGVLCSLKDATREKIEELMSENAELFGLDLDYANSKNVSILNIAMYLDVSDTIKLFGDAFNTEFKRIVDLISSDRTDKPVVIGGVNSGDGGGGTSGIKISNISTETNIQHVKPEQSEKNKFSDMSGHIWASDAVYERGIINGNGTGGFEPGRNVKREEFVKMVVAAFSLSGNPKAEINFIDVDSDDWFYQYILIAHSNSVISGINEEIFGVSNCLTRQDGAVILYNAAKAKKLSLSSATKADELIDFDNVADYASKAVASFYKMGCIRGLEDNSFRPYNSMTRAETATMIYNIMKFFELL